MIPTKLVFKGLNFFEVIAFLNPLPVTGKIVVYEDVFCMNDMEDVTKIPPVNKVLFKKKNFLSRLLFNPEQDVILIAYSMFESSLIKREWVEIINKYFDLVAVPDKFLVEVYKNSGVKKPIFVLPRGVDYQGHINKPLKSQRNKLFTFGNLSTTGDRKNTTKLIEAFIAAFKGQSDVQLIINSRYKNKKEYYKVLGALTNNARDKNIIYRVEKLSAYEYQTLFDTFDCYVSLSKGEGFSIIPREAMARGIPTIVTNNTGQSTIAQSSLVEVVASDIIRPAFYNDMEYNIGYNYDCTVEDAAQAMKNVYNNYPAYLHKSKDMREWAAQYEYEKLKPLYLNLMARPKKVILGERNEVTAEYIMTDSLQLFEKYQKRCGQINENNK